jgi:hypothetical protein
LFAERVNVTILDKGSRTVAIDGPVSSKSQVITDSNKVVNAGIGFVLMINPGSIQ